MALGYDGSIRIDTRINSKGFSRGITSMGNALKKLAGIVGIAFGTAAIINFGREAVNAASQLSNAWLGLQSIVEGQGRSFSKAKAFVEDYISDGLVPLSNAVTAYKNLAARGYDDTQIQQLMIALKDSASFGRQASYSLGDAIQTATEGLKNENSILVDNAGVTKNVSVMWREYAQSIGVGERSLTLAQRRQAEVNGILEETRFQTGDAAKLVDTYSGQVSMLSFNFQQLKVAVGNAIMPIVQAVLPGINKIITALTKLANVFAQVTALLFGKNTGLSQQADTQNQIASSGSAAADSTEDLSGAMDDAGDASKKAAKNMRGVLAGFDDLNVLASNTASSVEDAADTVGGIDTGGLDLSGAETGGELFGNVVINPELLQQIEELKARLQELMDLFSRGFKLSTEGLDFSGITNALNSIWDSLTGIFSDADVAEAAQRFLDSLIYAFGAVIGAIVSIGSSIAEGILGGIAQYLESHSEDIKQWIITMFDVGTEINTIIANFAAALANIFTVFGGDNAKDIVENIISIFAAINGGVIEIFAKLGRDAIDALTAPIIENQELIKTTLDGLLEVISSVTGTIAEVVETAVKSIVQLYDEHIHPFIMAVKDAFTEWFAGILEGWNTYAKPALDELATRFQEVAEKYIVPMIEKAVQFLGKLMDALTLLLENVIKPFVSFIIDVMAPDIGLAINRIGSFFTSFLATASAVVGGIFDVLSGLVDYIVGVFTGDIDKQIKSIQKIIEGVVTTAIALGENLIRGLWEGISNVALWLKNKISEFCDGILTGIKDFFGIASPSKVMRDQVGMFLAEGVAEGIADGTDTAVEAARGLSEEVSAAASPDIPELEFSAQISGVDGVSAIQETWGAVPAWMQNNVATPLTEMFTRLTSFVLEGAMFMWEGLTNTFSGTAKWFQSALFAPVMLGFKQFTNSLIGMVEGFVKTTLDGVDALLSAVESIRISVPLDLGGGTLSYGVNYSRPPISLPRLANGAVIPPNHQFAAILGDQRSGYNVEAPVSMIQQAVTKGIIDAGISGGDLTITVPVYLDSREIYKGQKRVSWQKGKNLVGGLA